MFTLLKGGYCYAPEEMGIKDILIVDSKIFKIVDKITLELPWPMEVVDCRDKIICPGFIDQHVHITGGGGEEGPESLIPEIDPNEILSSGVTTIVGLLGFDAISRNMAGLLAKARSLKKAGISAYIYSGNYGIPTETLTGKISTDLVYVNEILGVGEVAISDHRSSQPTLEMLRKIAYEARLGGLVGAKAGVMHLHVGDGKPGLKPLKELLEYSDFPIDMFVPTHTNRSYKLFEEAKGYYLSGGNIDLTAGENNTAGIPVPEALLQLKGMKGLNQVTVSSDGNGSIPPSGQSGASVGRVNQLFSDIRQTLLEKKVEIPLVLKTVTQNPATVLKIFPQKGVLQEGSDADILILGKDGFNLEKVISQGEILKIIQE